MFELTFSTAFKSRRWCESFLTIYLWCTPKFIYSFRLFDGCQAERDALFVSCVLSTSLRLFRYKLCGFYVICASEKSSKHEHVTERLKISIFLLFVYLIRVFVGRTKKKILRWLGGDPKEWYIPFICATRTRRIRFGLSMDIAGRKSGRRRRYWQEISFNFKIYESIPWHNSNNYFHLVS